MCGEIPAALVAAAESRPHSRKDYAVYMFFKLRTDRREEWDEEAYLRLNPGVEEAIKQGHFVDGLQHFMVKGFQQRAITCWRKQGNGTDSRDSVPTCIH